MVYGSCILLQLGDKCDKPHQKVSTVSRKHLWNFLLADHCTAWWRIIISKDWPTTNAGLGGTWGGLSQYPSPTRSRFISELSIVTFQGCFYERCPFFSLNPLLFALCIVAPAYTQQWLFFDTNSGEICLKRPDKARVFHPEICPRCICCTQTPKEHHAEMLERWIFLSCRWAQFMQVLWSVLPESVGRCSMYPFPCFSQGCSLCICCTEEIFGNASKQEGTRS